MQPMNPSPEGQPQQPTQAPQGAAPPPTPEWAQRPPQRGEKAHPEAIVLVLMGCGIVIYGLIQLMTLPSEFYGMDGEEKAVLFAPFWQIAGIGLVVVALAMLLNAVKNIGR